MIKAIISLSCLAFLLIFTSCEREAVSMEKQGDFTVEFLFEKDGCKMYRFRDSGRPIYWSTCPGNVNYHTGGKSSQYVESLTNVIP